MGLNYFDKILYINLNHRQDRKKTLLEHLDKQGVKKDKIVRISAVYEPLNGHKGCAASHIKALEYAISNNLKNVLILEDDCEFTQSNLSTKNLISFFFQTIKEWDVFFLSARLFETQKTKYKIIQKVLKSTRAHAYSVNNKYFKKLKNCFDEAYLQLQNELFFGQTFQYAIDQYWHKLQVKDRWYILDPQLGRQSKSFSDIEYIEKNTHDVKEFL